MITEKLRQYLYLYVESYLIQRYLTKFFETDLYNGCGYYANEKISTSLFNRNSNYLDNDGHIRFEQKIALIEFKEAMKDNIDKWVEHLKKIIENRQGSKWHINIKDNMTSLK